MEAFEAMQKAGILHHSVKEHNMMVAKDGTKAYMIDFGRSEFLAPACDKAEAMEKLQWERLAFVGCVYPVLVSYSIALLDSRFGARPDTNLGRNTSIVPMSFL